MIDLTQSPEENSKSMRGTYIAAVLIAFVMTSLFSEVASACWHSGTFYFSKNLTDFKVGQYSQGGNYYYGVAGVLNTAFPPDPTTYPNAIAGQHVNQNLGTVDERFQGTSTPALIHVGWFVGFHQYNSTHRSSATVFAEFFRYSSSPVLFVGSGAQATTWYKSQLTGQTPDGKWHYDAWELVSGVWSRLGDGVDMTTSPTEQQVFGEASDPGSETSNDRCRYLSNTNGEPNSFASLQLFVDNVVWQNWEPASGRYACAFSEKPYRPDPSTISSSDCAQGTFWTRKYTDFIVGGP